MAENGFVNANRYPKNNYQNNEEIVNNNRAQTPHNPSAHNSNASESATKKRGKSKNANPASSSAKKQSKNPVRKLFQSCAQCCGRKKAKIVKSKTSFVESIKEKAKKCRTKKKRSKKRAAVTVELPDTEKERRHKDPVTEKERIHKDPDIERIHKDPDISREDKQGKKIENSKKSKKKKRKREHKKSEPEDAPSPTASESDHRKLSLSQILGADGQDFAKSCCYLCAKNAMAIAAAISGQKDKSHVSIQTSVRFKERADTSDKSCSPMMYVRTVQSSVKVRTRDMGTLHPEKKKKSKKTRPKLNFKRFSIIPKVKLPGYPRVRTVACETDKSMGHNNIPQCRARHGTHCVAEK